MRKFYGTLVWFIATLFVVYSFCLNTAAAVFENSVKVSLHASNMGVAVATSAFILGFACMQIPAGYLLDRYNARFVVSFGILLLALGNILISFSHHLFLFTLSNFLQGLGASFAFIAAGILISQWFSGKMFPILFGLTQTVSCVLSGLIHYWFVVILATQTWNSIYQKLAIFGFCLLIVTFLIVKSPPGYQRGASISLLKALSIIFRNKQILFCAISAATSFGILLAYAGFWYLHVQKFYKIEDLQAVMISSMIFAGIGFGTPILGWLSNCWHSRIKVIHVSLVLGVMVLLFGIYSPHFDIDTLIIIKIFSFLIGFLLSGSMLYYTIVSEISTDNIRGVALSVTNTAVFLFNSIMLFIPYLLMTKTSQTPFTYLWILPFFIMFSLLINYFIKDTYQEATSESTRITSEKNPHR